MYLECAQYSEISPGIQEELRSMGKPRNQSLVTIENQK